MATINLRDFYPWYMHDEYVEVPEAIADELYADKRYEKAHRRRVYRNRAQYSLDTGDGIESEACVVSLSPDEIYERRLMICRLYKMLNSLPKTQGRRIKAHFILGMSFQSIAKAEDVDESAVRASVKRGLRSMKKHVEKLL